VPLSPNAPLSSCRRQATAPCAQLRSFDRVSCLQIAAARGGVLLVVDGADGLDDEGEDGIEELLACLPRVLPLRVRIVFSMRTGAPAFDKARPNTAQTAAEQRRLTRTERLRHLTR
jgi:hypothetical protein